ncbi:H-NS histone family protein [Chromobacterium haemolyticum]|uniref:H-NS histone family protein n=1 Tax=Chromobacterium haemolyticum TaxID=394935 RepID=A0ABS3GNM3_9NEIS|nr:H-NS histone family protein [Chromobacterium haemolyticum]MBK0415147.1 H-NS histone family protein [Chromobacterium haemolyticum]MBO0416639.1 H-NS histone family protein [Chromobacterium haemolyticum]MBO0499785.1 H-NS histone family protein [Chromobacterium haemolyticum]
MAKDANDSVTLELIPAAKKRGRPASGKALTNAERQRRFRMAQKQRVHIDLSSEDWADVMVMLQLKYEADANSQSQLSYAHIVEHFYRAGLGKAKAMPAWFEENRYKEPVSVTENQPTKESVTVTEIEVIEDKPVTVTKKPRVKKALAQVQVQSKETVTVTETPDTSKAVTVTKNNFPARYVHPHECMLTWTGRGRQPQWVKHWLDGGGQLADLEVSST